MYRWRKTGVNLAQFPLQERGVIYVYTSSALSNSDLTDWLSSFPQEYNVFFCSSQTSQRTWNHWISLNAFMDKGCNSDLTLWVHKSGFALLRQMKQELSNWYKVKQGKPRSVFPEMPPSQESHLQMALQKKGWATDKWMLNLFQDKSDKSFWKWHNRS